MKRIEFLVAEPSDRQAYEDLRAERDRLRKAIERVLARHATLGTLCEADAYELSTLISCVTNEVSVEILWPTLRQHGVEDVQQYRLAIDAQYER